MIWSPSSWSWLTILTCSLAWRLLWYFLYCRPTVGAPDRQCHWLFYYRLHNWTWNCVLHSYILRRWMWFFISVHSRIAVYSLVLPPFNGHFVISSLTHQLTFIIFVCIYFYWIRIVYCYLVCNAFPLPYFASDSSTTLDLFCFCLFVFLWFEYLF